MTTFQELEQMQEELLKKGAFDKFEKEPDENDEPLFDKKQELSERILAREMKPRWWYELEKSEKINEEELFDMWNYVTTKQFYTIIQKENLPIEKARIEKMLRDLSKLGFKLKIFTRQYCSRCGKEIIRINMDKFADAINYCDDCDKYIKDLNKKQEQLTL